MLLLLDLHFFYLFCLLCSALAFSGVDVSIWVFVHGISVAVICGDNCFVGFSVSG